MLKEDERGKILGITQDIWQEINFIQSKKGAVRGNHYHKKTHEGFYVISGKIKITVTNINSKKNLDFEAKSGDIFVIEPYELHTFLALEDSSWINMLSKSMKENEDFFTNTK